MDGARSRHDLGIPRVTPSSRSLLKKFPETVAKVVQNEGDKPLRVMFQDEGRFGRISDARHCWAPAGVRPEVPLQIVREYTYAFVALSPHDGIMDSLVLPEVNTKMMSLFLSEVASRHQDECILMFMDQAGWHRAGDLKIPENMRIQWLPCYCPQCNPVEHIWDEIREKWFPNLVFQSLDGVEDKLVEALASLENNAGKVHSLTGFDWIISLPMIAT
jgi:putative transposase